MSGEVLLYQLAILISIVAAGMLFGKRGSLLMAVGWALWTAVMVFTKFLFILQGLTVFIGFSISQVLSESPRYHVFQKWLKITAAAGVVLVVGFFALIIYLESDRKANTHIPAAEKPSVQEQPSITQPPRSENPTSDLLYENAVRGVEKKYPKLNPDLPFFDQAAMDSVVQRRNYLISQGMEKYIAVQIAADQYFSRNQEGAKEIYRCARGIYQDFPCTK